MGFSLHTARAGTTESACLTARSQSIGCLSRHGSLRHVRVTPLSRLKGPDGFEPSTPTAFAAPRPPSETRPRAQLTMDSAPSSIWLLVAHWTLLPLIARTPALPATTADGPGTAADSRSARGSGLRSRHRNS